MLVIIIKYLVMLITSVYAYERISGVNSVNILKKAILLFIVTPILVITRMYFPMFSIGTIVLVLSFFYGIISGKKIKVTLICSIIAVSVSYILYALGMIVALPISSLEYVLLTKNNLEYLSDICFEITIAIFRMFFCFLLFKIKRIKKGIPEIVSKISNDVGLIIGCVVVLLATILFKTDSDNYTPIYPIIVLFVCLLGFIAYLWWCKRITNNYLNKVQQRNLDMAEQTIAKQKEEIEYLSKIVHKDNKLIGALELSLRETQGVDKDKLSAMSKERESILYTYKESEKLMQKTGVFSIDMMMNYLLKRAFDNNAKFDAVVSGNINYMVKNVIAEDDLRTLLADIGENAVIAVASEERRNILLSIGVRENGYYIDVFDSGVPFEVNVIENYGRSRYTTHKDSGGSGIGLMTAKELLSKYKASFELEEIENNSLYTKRVSVVFDSLSQTRIFSDRQEILELQSQRDDIIFCRLTVNK